MLACLNILQSFERWLCDRKWILLLTTIQQNVTPYLFGFSNENLSVDDKHSNEKKTSNNRNILTVWVETKYNSLRYSSVCKVSSRTYNHNNNHEPTETHLEAAIIYTYTKSTKYKPNSRSFIIKYQWPSSAIKALELIFMRIVIVLKKNSIFWFKHA